MAAHLADPAFLEWRAAGLAEPRAQPQYDLDLPERRWPGSALGAMNRARACITTPATDTYVVAVVWAGSVPTGAPATGCGMGDYLKRDVEGKVLSVPGIKEADVQVVFEPVWDQSRMSEAARLQLGLM